MEKKAKEINSSDGSNGNSYEYIADGTRGYMGEVTPVDFAYGRDYISFSKGSVSVSGWLAG
jgi:hypothetical protein